MAEKHVSVTLTFATNANPADVAMSVGAAVTAEVADTLTGMNWHGFELGDSAEGECPHTSWEENRFELGDGTPVASRTCADCKEQLPTILVEGPSAGA